MSAAGSAPSRQDRGCWYDRIAAGLAASVEGESDGARVRGDGASRSTSRRNSATPAGRAKATSWSTRADRVPEHQALALEAASPARAWARDPARAEPDPPTPLAPSQPLPDEAMQAPRAFSPLARTTARWQRGRLLHDLLRHLPALPAAEREAAARRFLAQPAHGIATPSTPNGRPRPWRHRVTGSRGAVRPTARAPRCR